MFLERYLNEYYTDLVYSNYEEAYLNMLDEENFIKIYQLFKKYNIYFIESIILNYLEIFEMDYTEVENGLLILKEKLGEDYVNIIGKNMIYLNEIINKNN